MTTTPFLELAKRIDEDIDNPDWYCCPKLPIKMSKLFKKMFRPDETESLYYDMSDVCWLDSRLIRNRENNQFRVLILLLAHEVWLDENNNTKK